MQTINAAEISGRLAQILQRVSEGNEKFLIEDGGRGAAAIVPLDDLNQDEKAPGPRHNNFLFDETERLANLGHWEWDEVEKRPIHCSRELARLHGVSVDEFLARSSSLEAELEWIHPEDRDAMRQAIEKLQTCQVGYDIECRLLRADGVILHVREIAEPVFDAQGSHTRSIGFIQDITERKQFETDLRRARDQLEQRVEERTAELRAANQALRHEIGERKQAQEAADQSRELLASAVEALDEGFVIFDKEERLVLCNSAYHEIYQPIADKLAPGISLTEVARLTAKHCIGLDDDVEVEESVRQRMQWHKRLGVPFEQKLRDGRWIRVVDSALQEGWTVGTRRDLTDLKRIEEELRTSQARLLDAIESIAEGFVLYDADDRLLLHNQRYFEIYPDHAGVLAIGERYEDMLRIAVGRGQFKAATGREESWIAERLKYRANSQGAIEQELADGRWVRVEDRPTREGGIVGLRTDISELKHATDALKVREEQLRQAQHLARIGIFIWDDVADRCIYCSDELAALLGISVEEFLEGRGSHTSILPWIHEEDRARYDSVMTKALEAGVTYDVYYRVYDTQGRVHHWRELGEPEFDASGRQVRTFGAVQDISNIRRIENELRENEARYRELFEYSPVAIWEEDWSSVRSMLDELAAAGVSDWRQYFDNHRDQLRTAYDAAVVVEISRAAAEIYGDTDTEKLEQTSVSALVIDEELDAFHDTLLAFLSGQEAFEVESKDTTFEDEEIITRKRVVIPPKYRNDWSRVLYAIEDTTARAKLEDQLRQAQKMDAVGQLTGGIAHDFNNLLAVIMGNAEILATDAHGDDPELRSVIAAAKRGAELTQRLLAFSRKQTLQPRAVDLNALVGGMIGLLGRTLGATIEIKTSLGSGLSPANVDPGQLENALLNLAINARDAMASSGILTIETSHASLDSDYVKWHADVTPGDYLLLAVSDNGCGMSAEVLNRAIEPFFTTKRIGEGSGLGLSMIHGFAKQSGGHLALYSEAGHGTTVKLYLPPAQQSSIDDRSDQGLDAVPQGHGEVVLILEDDPDVRLLAVRLVDRLGYEVVEAEEAARALALLDQGTEVDLVLSDVVLPGGMSGPEFADEAMKRFPDLKVIFMSGYPAVAAKRNGFVGSDRVLLNKPFEKARLAAALRDALDG